MKRLDSRRNEKSDMAKQLNVFHQTFMAELKKQEQYDKLVHDVAEKVLAKIRVEINTKDATDELKELKKALEDILKI